MLAKKPWDVRSPFMSTLPSISIVINTLNRAASLRNTLDSLRWLRYQGCLEVIVVNGPSSDDTDQLLLRHSETIRSERCDVANLSVSRNIGVRSARGDIVAFLDDDAIPEPEWLDQIAEAYDDERVGAAGGFVFDHTGYDFQYRFGIADRLGNADVSLKNPTPWLCFPQSYQFPHLLGANSTFRRSAICEIGGFDEEYEYYLDETDVLLRIVDAGYLVRQLPNAFVHHKFAPSHLRDSGRVLRNRFPVLKNKIYFSFKNGRCFHPIEEIVEDCRKFVERQRNEVKWLIGAHRLPASELAEFEAQADRAWEEGVRRGLDGPKQDGHWSKNEGTTGTACLRFSTLRPAEDRRVLVLVSRYFPPGAPGGIATLTFNLSRSLADRGHTVHVIAQSCDIDRVDFEGGIWVHRVVPRNMEPDESAKAIGISQDLWNWSATALKEAKRISTHRKIDVVEAPIWDSEGIAFLLDGSWPIATSLETPLQLWLKSNPEWLANSDWMSSHGTPMIALERKVMIESQAIRASTRAIVADIQQAYGFQFRSNSVHVIPHGLGESTLVSPTESRGDSVEVLFVGRLERRKGIDVLLDAIPEVCATVPSVRFRLIGDNTLPSEHGHTYEGDFWASPASCALRRRVVFEGRVSDTQRNQAYANCDIFVSPSRYESFGLIFLEAMRYGKPVIGCRVGGMTEVIDEDVTGLLVEPGDSASLAKALIMLASQPELRRRLGESGAVAFRERFTAERMAADSIGLYDEAIRNFDSDRARRSRSARIEGNRIAG